MDYAGLKAEIALPAYAGMSDDQIAAALTANTVTVYQDVPIGKVVGYLAIVGKLPSITGYAGSDVATKIAAAEFTALATAPSVTAFQCSDPATFAAVQSFLTTFVSSNLISSDDESVLLGYAQSMTSRAAQLGFGPHCDMTQEIAAARKWS